MTNSFSSIDEIWKIPYQQYVLYLKDKYGPVPYDYFCKENCKTTQTKNSRTNEGLVIHHICEDKHILLAEKSIAKELPFEYQKAENLVYCNMVEHLILHIKIAEERKDKHSGVGIGGCKLILQQINAWIEHGRPSGWRGNLYDTIQDTFDKKAYCIYSQLSDYHYAILHLFDVIWNDEIYSNPKEALFIHPLELAYTYIPNEYCTLTEWVIWYQKANDAAIVSSMKAVGPFCDYDVYTVDSNNIRYRNHTYPFISYIQKAPQGYPDKWYVKNHRWINHCKETKLKYKQKYNIDLHYGFE